MSQLLTAFVALLLSFCCITAWGQGAERFFQTRSKTHFYYVEVNDTMATIYKMGRYLDKAGTGYSIRQTDTLTRNSEGRYTGKELSIAGEDGKRYLATEGKKVKRLLLDGVTHSNTVHQHLNNAYFLDRYFEMSEDLHKTYPLYHHSFRNGFRVWEDLQNKETDHLLFRSFANQRLNALKDSIRQQQEGYVLLTSHLIGHINSMDYPALKDSLSKLPAAYGQASAYYATVLNEVAKQRPDHFFRLAEDLPDQRALIFGAVADSKEVVQGLKAVKGHDAVKKAFFKDRKFGKTIPYKIIGAYVFLAGLITFLIVSQ